MTSLDTTTVLFEFPLNDRLRAFMRLENLFNQINHFISQPDPLDSQGCLLYFIELLNLSEKNDIRNEIVKELERHITTLNRFLPTPSVNQQRLTDTLDSLSRQRKALQSLHGRIDQTLSQHEFLQTLRQRLPQLAIYNGFDIPSLQYWLNQPIASRRQQLQNWFEAFTPIVDGIRLILRLLRQSALFRQETANNGFYEQNLIPQQETQMVRCRLLQSTQCYPELSANRHRITLRFLTHPHTEPRPHQVSEAVAIEIASCRF